MITNREDHFLISVFSMRRFQGKVLVIALIIGLIFLAILFGIKSDYLSMSFAFFLILIELHNEFHWGYKNE